MSKFIEGQDRSQGTLFPERLDDYVEEDNLVRVIDGFIDDLDISGLGFRTELLHHDAVSAKYTCIRPYGEHSEL